MTSNWAWTKVKRSPEDRSVALMSILGPLASVSVWKVARSKTVSW